MLDNKSFLTLQNCFLLKCLLKLVGYLPWNVYNSIQPHSNVGAYEKADDIFIINKTSFGNERYVNMSRFNQETLSSFLQKKYTLLDITGFITHIFQVV